MASVEQRLTSWALSLVQALETDAEMRVRLLGVVIGTVVTIIMWVGHLIYPHVLQILLDSEVELKFVAALALAPPFTAAFSVGHLIFRQRDQAAEDESGPMAAYFYRRSADRKWKIAIAAGIIAAINFLLMVITSYS